MQPARTSPLRVLVIQDTSPEPTAALAFGLADVLRLLLPELTLSSWRLFDVQTQGVSENDFLSLSNSQTDIGGDDLLSLSTRITEVTTGDFQGQVDSALWVRIRAQPLHMAVITADVSVIERVHARFSHVSEVALADYFRSPQGVPP